jgi:hypothetical protein
MTSTPPPTHRHPLTITAIIVLIVGLAFTALLLLLPMTADTLACGSVLVNDDPNLFLGEGGCVDALATRRNQALVVGALTLVAAGVLAGVRLWMADDERWKEREAAGG